jgi:hypothetical protein
MKFWTILFFALVLFVALLARTEVLVARPLGVVTFCALAAWWVGLLITDMRACR